MRGAIALSVVFAATLAHSGAQAMNSRDPQTLGRCTVVGGKAASAAATLGLCGAIERAVAVHAPHSRYQVEVKVLSTSRLSAKVLVNGRTLPEQRFAVMDGELNSASVERFADALASTIADASKR